tara:strand:+ start:45 stop:323 length:279 start_codon:yes stop_codon:yes gene_type:complete
LDFFTGGNAAKNLTDKELLFACQDLGCEVKRTSSGYIMHYQENPEEKITFSFHHKHKGTKANYHASKFRTSLLDFFASMGITEKKLGLGSSW